MVEVKVNPREGLEPRGITEFEGLVYHRRYIIPLSIGERLEGDEFRASAERDVDEELDRWSKMYSRARLEPAGRHVTVVVELGKNDLDSLPSGKPDLDATIDDAMKKAVDGELDEPRTEGVTTANDPVWDVRCIR